MPSGAPGGVNSCPQNLCTRSLFDASKCKGAPQRNPSDRSVGCCSSSVLRLTHTAHLSIAMRQNRIYSCVWNWFFKPAFTCFHANYNHAHLLPAMPPPIPHTHTHSILLSACGPNHSSIFASTAWKVRVQIRHVPVTRWNVPFSSGGRLNTPSIRSWNKPLI